jgi:hypothetical protein
VSLSSCQDKLACPAYQSYFILNDSVRYQKFSHFLSDSLPKNDLKVKKNKDGIIVLASFRSKEKSLESVPYETVFPYKPLPFDSLLLAEVDSLMSDPGELMASTEKFPSHNVDQGYYNFRFGEYLKPYINPLDDQEGESTEKVGFLKRIFGFGKKKKKQELYIDEEGPEEEQESEEFDSVDFDFDF